MRKSDKRTAVRGQATPTVPVRKKPVEAGKTFQKVAVAGVVIAAAGVFALGSASLLRAPAPEQVTAVPAVPAVSAKPVTIVRIEEAAENPSRFGKSAIVTLASSTGKLQSLFKEIGYELDGVRERGEVPRIFVASLPADLRHLPQPAQRKVTFIKSTLPLILHVNELILQERRRILSLRSQQESGQPVSAADESWLAAMTELYGLKIADIDALLERVDIIPPSLAIAQAAEESGWGTSRFAREGNALFGQRSYRAHKKGIVPAERAEGMTFKVRAFDHLVDGVKAYVHNLNSHFAYDEFRAARAKLRSEQAHIDGYTLAGSLLRYSERGADYIDTIRLIMRSNALQVFDASRLGNSKNKKDGDPDA